MESKLQRDKKASEKKMAKKDYNAATKINAYQDDENFAEEISLKRIDNLSAEYQLLNFGITSASILFKEI